MKKLLSVLLVLVMLLGILPSVGLAADYSVSATAAFSWNFAANAQNGTLPTAVSWGDQRACFMTFELPPEIISMKDDIKVTASLTADMSFNNGRRSGQAPVVTIISADADIVNSASLTGGVDTSTALADAWRNGTVLGTFDTLNADISEVLDLTEIVNNGAKSIGLYLTCREEDGYDSAGIVNFNSPILNLSTKELTIEEILNEIDIPYNIDEDYELPTKIYGREITWSDTPEVGNSTVYKTITASAGGAEKKFDVMIMGKNDRFVAAYTTNESTEAGKSMHLALKTEDSWLPLNFGLGVLFANADLDDGTVAGTTKVLDKPWLYRKDNGKIGVAAKTMTVSGDEDKEPTLWETDDLVNFAVVGSGTEGGYENAGRAVADGIDGDVSSVLQISEAEADYLLKKLGEVTNIDVEPISLKTEPGKSITELPGLTADYSDGSVEEIPVIWDTEQLEDIDFNTVGVYTVSGTAAVSDYPSPMISGAADPVIYRYNDKYYFTATNETGGQVDIYIRGADTIDALMTAAPVLIFEHTSSGDNSGCNWAPELHEIGGELYCLFASSTTGKWNAVQSRIMKCTGDPLDPDAWEDPVRITQSDGSPLISQGITLDMTYFEAAGRYYYCWAERPITDAGNGNSQLVIAEIDPADPYRIITSPVVICVPSYGWDRCTATVDEGPYILKHGGKLYLTFSGSGVDNTYCLGLLMADESADLLDAKSWKEIGYPVLASEHVAGEFGPGHNSFTKDEYGRDVIVLHMKPNGGTRSATGRIVHYGFDGTPILYMTADRYLKPEYRNVTATIVVANENTTEEELLLSADAQALSFANRDGITADLMLEYQGENGSSITWKSSDASVITDDGRVTRGDVDRTVIMTATLALGEKTLTREFSLTVLAAEKEEAYLFAYFTGNSADQERLYYGVSKDGVNFRALNGGASVLTSDLGTGCIRDPFIFKGEDGYYYIIATDMRSSLGWSSNYATVVYKTPDLINIVDKAWINYRDFPSAKDCTRAWAPQAVWCPEKNAYMVYLAMSVPDSGYGTVMYRQYATDLCDQSTYTDVEIMLDQPAGTDAGAIDGDIVFDKFHNRYIMYYDGKRIAVADTLSGTWIHAETKYTDGQLPMETSSGASMDVEGSNIWKIIGEDRWIIAADGTSFNGGRYALVETTDFESYTQLWSEKGDYSFDFTPRHGYVIPISARELENLFDAYGEVELPSQETETPYTLTIDAAGKGTDIQDDMYGIFFEDINYAADGGIYSEVIKNRSFEMAHCNPDKNEAYVKTPEQGWSTFNASAEYLCTNPLNDNNTTFVRLTADAGGGLSNDCYSGFAVHEDESFNVSVFARGDYDGNITVSIVDGDNVLGSTDFSGIGKDFKKFCGIIKTKGIADSATVKIILDKTGTLDMDMISVMSRDTYNGRENGLRKDIVQMLADLHPGFVRFPGGCVAEGYYLDNRYSWKDSVGPVESRKENWNRWQTGSGDQAYDYCQTLGLGFYEYFLLCEDIGAKALPVVSVGIACQYQSGEASSWDELYSVYIQDVIDLIEFANGDPETNEWAALRAEMGHPEPFNLEYVGIGNEQWNTADNRFFERYEAFETEIHKLYPDIKLISTSGPSADGENFINAWDWLEGHKGDVNFTYAVDEHYYRTPDWFLGNINRYDYYDRDGFSVFAGEYAANGTYGNTLYSALSEAAYMTGLERNSDIVKMASYAPLLAKTGYNQWSPNLIWFDNSAAYGSPDYYVQSLYANNNGDYTLPNKIEQETCQLQAGIGTWNTAAQFRNIKVTDNETGEVTSLDLGESMKITVSHEPEEANPGTNLIDGSTDTRWAVNTYGATAVVDIGEIIYVSKLAVNFMAKAGRTYYYKLETSTDGLNYTTVFDGASLENSAAAHYTRVDGEARYIRLTSKGSSEGTSAWFSPTELTVYDKNNQTVKNLRGVWNLNDGVYSQTDTSAEGAFNTAPLPSENYTLELQAMKTAGSEGFLIPFNYEDSNNYIFWNIGGWNNTQSAVQRVVDGTKTTVSDNVANTIESNRWYDIKIIADEKYAYCYLDGNLIHTQAIKLTKGPVYSSVVYDEESGDIIIKLVNTAAKASTVNIDIANAEYINPMAELYILTGNGLDAANTADDPDNVSVEERSIDYAGSGFVYKADALSFTVIRLHTRDIFAVYAETLTASLDNLPETVPVHMSDGSVRNLAVKWRVPKGNSFAHEGSYDIEGKVAGTNVYATATVNIREEGSITIENDSKALFTASGIATAIIATYNFDGVLQSVRSEVFNGEKEIEFTVPVEGMVKLMLWNEKGEPLVNAIEKSSNKLD